MEQEHQEQTIHFFEEPGVTDVALVLEGKKLFVNKFILAVASPVFKAMFTSEFKEKDTQEVELPGKQYEDVLEFLKCIYPNILKPLTFATITQVLPLMHEYDCKRQVDECNTFLMKMVDPEARDLTLDKLLLCLSQSNVAGLSESYTKCLESASRYCSESLLSSEEFLKLSHEIKEDLYRRRLKLLERTGKSVVENLNYSGQMSRCNDYSNFSKLLEK